MTSKTPNKTPKPRHGHDRGRQRLRRLSESLARLTGGQGISVQFALLAILSAVTVILAFPVPVEYQAGDVAEYTVRANRALKVLDHGLTRRNTDEAEARVPPVFVLDDAIIPILAERAADIFSRGRDLVSPLDEQPEGRLSSGEIEPLLKSFNELFRLSSDQRPWHRAMSRRFSPDLERQVTALASEIMAIGLLADGRLADRQRPVSVISAASGREYVLPYAALMDKAALSRFMDTRARALSVAFNSDEADLIVLLARGLARPNLSFDQEETDRRRADARALAPIAYLDIREGEVLVREGLVINEAAMDKIRAMQEASGGSAWLYKFGGLFVVMFVFFNSGLFLALANSRRRDYRRGLLKEQLLVILLLILAALMAHGAGIFGSSLSWDFDSVDSRTVFYAAPMAAVTMLAAVFFGVRRASVIALFAAMVATVVSPTGKFAVFVYSYNGAIAATWCLSNMNERGQLIPASFWVMVVNCLTLLGLTFYGEMYWSRQTAYNFMAAAASGVLSGVVASGMIPLIESAFGFSTDLKLMELGNLDRPLLRELMLSAPGTYHHSVIVGAMVEAAAETIGANPHLARVGAYYHDIGKMKKPLYFVENQTGENRHDALSPSMSALILIGHVKDGAELAREYHLPQAIINIVEQHHGTSLMAFFHHKAKEQRQEGQPEINEGDFRYPGPRPRGKEAGLVMLADVCEAATRSLSEPTPAKIHNMVRQLVNSVFSDGQLEDSELTGREIGEITASFTAILTGIYHHRVAYPGGKDPGPEGAEPGKEAFVAPRSGYGHLSVEPPKGLAH